VHKDATGKIIMPLKPNRIKVNTNSFKGKIYVLINGSFSASSLISSNLKVQRVTFVRGNWRSFNGTVGIYAGLKHQPKQN
jgi:hypothetical protein